MINILKPHEIKKVTHHRTLFFSSDGVCVDQNNNTPFVSFDQGARYFCIKSVIQDGDILIVQGTLSSGAPFYIVNPKALLREVLRRDRDCLLRAIHLVEWDSKVKYCSACGGTIHFIDGAATKRCNLCNKLFFPNLSPAVIILIERGEQILLARSPHFVPGIYSALAGFVDLGESAEAAAIREVKEEVGLNICNLQYFGTQSWPFPSSFMIAFTAEYASGEIHIDPHEIEDARWFSRHTLPNLPPMPSIARMLIDSFIKRF